MPHIINNPPVPPGGDPTAKRLRDVGTEFTNLGKDVRSVAELLLLLALVVESLKARIDANERREIEAELAKLATKAAELRGEVEQPPPISEVLDEALALSETVRKAVK